jgi:hypothetical protein
MVMNMLISYVSLYAFNELNSYMNTYTAMIYSSNAIGILLYFVIDM